MNSRIIIITMIIVASGFAFESFAVPLDPTTPPSADGRSLTTPPSSTRPALTKTPSEDYFARGNLVITGNVSGGRHFQGVVPYRSTAELNINENLALGSLNSFIRRSAGVPYYKAQTLSTQP